MGASSPRRVLIVEDEVLVAMDVETLVDRAGYRVVGPVATVSDALTVIGDRALDIAVLDVNLGNQTAFAIADALAAAKVPFVWLTGHSPEVIPREHRDRPLIAKPFVQDALIRALTQALPKDTRAVAG